MIDQNKLLYKLRNINTGHVHETSRLSNITLAKAIYKYMKPDSAIDKFGT